METILEMDEHKTRKNAVWTRLVTVESSGVRHILTQWKEETPAAARRTAKRENVRLVNVSEVTSG